jgi:hypothetical protein
MLDWSELGGLVRFAGGVRRFARARIAADQAGRIVRDRIARRDDCFLQKVELAVFRHPPSPYRKLMRAAGCEYGDLERAVRADGVEGALRRLAEAGVLVTWEEFKGRVAVRRGNSSWQFHERDFDNPLVREHFRSSSSGSSGPPVRTRLDLEDLTEATVDWAAWFHARGWLGRPFILWTDDYTGIASRYLKCAKFGMPYRKWFVTVSMQAFEHRLRSAVVHGIARWAAGLARPEPAPVSRPEIVARYLLELLDRGELPVVNTSPSAAAALSLVAREQGRRLDGVAFVLGGEPVTAARKTTIEASGALAAATYGTSEGGWIAAQFPGAAVADEVHLFRDAYAVVARPSHAGPDTGLTADDGSVPLLFTNLRRAGPKVLLNAELGDSGIIVAGAPDSASALGCDVSLHTIRSFRKITAWGMTFASRDLYPLLEDVLPTRFGGAVGDYQLVEDQDRQGVSSLRLLISPRVGAIDETLVREAFLHELGARRSQYGPMATLLHQADALRIERRNPVATARDKVLPVVPQRAG